MIGTLTASNVLTYLGRHRDSNQRKGRPGGNDHIRIHVMVERVFDVHVLNKGYSLCEDTLVSMTPATKHVGQEGESRWWNQVVVDFFVIGCFRKEEVMDWREGQDGIELKFQPRKEFLALVTVKQHHVTNSQLEGRLGVKGTGK